MKTGKRSKSGSAKIGAKQEIDFVVNQMTRTTTDTSPTVVKSFMIDSC